MCQFSTSESLLTVGYSTTEHGTEATAKFHHIRSNIQCIGINSTQVKTNWRQTDRQTDKQTDRQI